MKLRHITFLYYIIYIYIAQVRWRILGYTILKFTFIASMVKLFVHDKHVHLWQKATNASDYIHRNTITNLQCNIIRTCALESSLWYKHRSALSHKFTCIFCDTSVAKLTCALKSIRKAGGWAEGNVWLKIAHW